MNTTIERSNNTSIDDERGTRSTHAKEIGRTAKFRARCRRLAVIAAAAVPAVAGSVAVLSSSPASAAIGYHTYFRYESKVTCDSVKDTMRLVVWAAPTAGYAVHVQFRHNMTNVLTRQTGVGSWTATQRVASHTVLQDATIYRMPSAHWSVTTDMRYYTASGWSAPIRITATHYSVHPVSRMVGHAGAFCTT